MLYALLGFLWYCLVRLFMILLAIIVCLGTVVFIRIKRKPKPGPNPFLEDGRRSPEPVILNEKARDAILKKRFAAAKLEGHYDTIVIGSGCSGLTTGVILSRAGQRVLVLEQHDQAGGYCHTFFDKGFEFDTGVHYVGKMHHGQELRQMFDQLTEGQVQWQPMDDDYDMVMVSPVNKEARKWIPIRSGTRRYIDCLTRYFPKETFAIHKFVELIETYCESIIDAYVLKFIPFGLTKFFITTGLHKYISKCYKPGNLCNVPMSELVDDLTDNQELRVCLTYAISNAGSTPNKAPFGVFATLVDHYIEGSFYPVGGSSEAALQMCRVIEKFGGQVLCAAPVNEILFDEEGKACGVDVGQKKVRLYAPNIVSSAGVDVTFNTLIPKSIAEKSFVYPLAQSMKPSNSGVFLFAGLEGSFEDLGMKVQNYWIFDYTGDSWASYLEYFYNEVTLDQLMDEDLPFPVMFMAPGSAKDPLSEKKLPGKTSISVVVTVPYKWFAEFNDEKKGRRGERYETVKSYFRTRMWHTLLHLFPKFDGQVLHMDAGTPLTCNYYAGKRFGENFGVDLTTTRMDAIHQASLRPQTGIPGLFLTGVDITMGGMVPAAIAGMITSSIILRRNVRNDLKDLYKRLKEDKIN